MSVKPMPPLVARVVANLRNETPTITSTEATQAADFIENLWKDNVTMIDALVGIEMLAQEATLKKSHLGASRTIRPAPDNVLCATCGHPSHTHAPWCPKSLAGVIKHDPTHD